MKPLKIKLNSKSLSDKLQDIPHSPQKVVTYGAAYISIVLEEVNSALDTYAETIINQPFSVGGLPTDVNIGKHTSYQSCTNYIKRELTDAIKFFFVLKYKTEELEVAVNLSYGTVTVGITVINDLYNHIRLHH